jgi:hypothetical protein
MEPTSVYAISSGISAIAGSPVSSVLGTFIAKWFLKRRLKKRSGGLLIMKGVSTLCQKLTTSSHLYLDVDRLYQQLTAPKSAEDLAAKSQAHNPVDEYLSYPIIKNHISNISSVFKGKIILVSKSLDLLNSMPIYPDSIIFGCFSRDMEDSIGQIIYSSPTEHNNAIVEKFRDLQKLPPSQIIMVSTLNELYDKTAEHFGSTRVSV